jgi:hypothetical protein
VATAHNFTLQARSSSRRAASTPSSLSPFHASACCHLCVKLLLDNISSLGSCQPFLGRPPCLAMSTLAQRTQLDPYPSTGLVCACRRPHLTRAIKIFICAVRVWQIPLNRQTHFTRPPVLKFYPPTLPVAGGTQSRLTSAPATRFIRTLCLSLSQSPTLPLTHCSAPPARRHIFFVPYTPAPFVAATSTKSDFLVIHTHSRVTQSRAARRHISDPLAFYNSDRYLAGSTCSACMRAK